MMRMDSSNKMCVQYCLVLSMFARRNTMLSNFQNEYAKNNFQNPMFQRNDLTYSDDNHTVQLICIHGMLLNVSFKDL